MHTFEPKPKATQQTTSPKSPILGRGLFEADPPLGSSHHSRRPNGNQAVQRMLQIDAEESAAESTGLTPPGFGYDVSRVPLHPPGAAGMQAKPATDSPGDSYEQEADRVAEQVMRMPEPRLAQGHERLQRKHVGSADTGHIAVPATVHEVLRSPGQPLDPVARGFMEPRFGHDFSRVRVHSGPAAEQSARDVDANAYTMGHHIVSGAGDLTSAGQRQRRLLAHELTHVLQQTGPLARAPSALHPGILQRDPKAPEAKKKPDPKKKEDPKVEAAKKKLQDTFGIGQITQEDGASWTESQLRKLHAAFSKMSPEEQESLKGATLHRVHKIDRPKGMERMDPKIVIAAETFPGFMQFTAKGFDPKTPLHEAGHLIRFKQLREITSSSKAGIEEEALRKKVRGVGPRGMIADMNAVQRAASALRDSNDEERATRSRELDDAMDASIAFRMGPEVQSASDPKALEAQYEALDNWVNAVRRVASEKDKIISEFINIVNANKLAKKGFAPFTKYVEFNWPKKPGEFLVECYATWRNNPNYIKTHAKPLYEWFQSGGHLVSKAAGASKKP